MEQPSPASVPRVKRIRTAPKRRCESELIKNSCDRIVNAALIIENQPWLRIRFAERKVASGLVFESWRTPSRVRLVDGSGYQPTSPEGVPSRCPRAPKMAETDQQRTARVRGQRRSVQRASCRPVGSISGPSIASRHSDRFAYRAAVHFEPRSLDAPPAFEPLLRQQERRVQIDPVHAAECRHHVSHRQ